MTSQKQAEANRRNALQSTGPKSTKGKARASLNALKHGLLAKDIVLPSEDEEIFEDLRRALITELVPEGSLEEQLAERIAACLWRLRRVYPIEAGILVWESLTIEHGSALEEAKEYKEYKETFSPFTTDVVVTEHITDKEKHNEAMICASKAKQLLRREAQGPGVAFKRDAENANALSKLSRYETAIERSLFHALHALEHLQATRRVREVSAPEVVDAPVNVRQVRHRSRSRNGV